MANPRKEFKRSYDNNGFPVNEKGEQILLQDAQGNILFILNSNFLAKFKENSCIKFNPKDKNEVRVATETLVNVLTNDFIKNIESYFVLDITDEAKKRLKINTNPKKIPTVQMYFSWVDNWLEYISTVVINIEFKIMFYKRFKEKTKKDIISLETGLIDTKAPNSYINFAIRWFNETDKNIELERQSKLNPEGIESKPSQENVSKGLDNKNRISAKYYALYHWVLIEMGKAKQFEKNENSFFLKNEIIKFAEKEYNLKNGQGFYRAFTNGTVDLTRKHLIPKDFGKKYKKIIINISNDDKSVKDYLKTYPD